MSVHDLRTKTPKPNSNNLLVIEDFQMPITLSDDLTAKLLVSSVCAEVGKNSPSPLVLLQELVASEFGDAEFDFRVADAPNGFHFLNIYHEELEVAIEWKSGCGFGLSCFRSDADDLAGLYSSPDEWFKSLEAVYHRIASLLIEKTTTKSIPATMADIRHERGLSQASMSAQLDITQATYSKLERREDVKLSSLRKVVEAMGGVLKIEARFPESQDVREVTFS